jgi:glycosyltransferase involved in cell wall biosynthesis
MQQSQYELIFVCPHPPEAMAVDSSLRAHTTFLEAPDRLLEFGGATLAAGYGSKLRVAASLFAYGLRLGRVFRQTHTRVVQCNNTRSLVTACIGAKIARAKLIWYVNGRLRNPMLDHLGFIVADRILFQNTANKDRYYPHLISRYESKIGIVECGIDVDELQELTTPARQATAAAELNKLAGKSDAVRIAYVGQLSPNKGVGDLLEATTVLREKGEAVLFLIGDPGVDEYRAYADGLMERYASAPGVHFLGYREDAITLLSLMQLYVLPSLSEGVPRTILEAMACNVAVIASDVGGIPEVVVDQVSGLLVPPSSPDVLAAAIEGLVRNEGERKRLAESAQVGLRQHWTMDANLQQLVPVHEALLHSHGRHGR